MLALLGWNMWRDINKVVALDSVFLLLVSLSAPRCVSLSIIIAIVLSITAIIIIIIILVVYTSFGHISWLICVKCYQMSVAYLSTYLELSYHKCFYQCRRVVVSSIDCHDNLKISWVILKSITDEIRTCENLFLILFIFYFCLCWKYLERVLRSLNYFFYWTLCLYNKNQQNALFTFNSFQ